MLLSDKIVLVKIKGVCVPNKNQSILQALHSHWSNSLVAFLSL